MVPIWDGRLMTSLPAVDQRGRPRPDGSEGTQGDDEGGQLEPGDEEAVDKPITAPNERAVAKPATVVSVTFAVRVRRPCMTTPETMPVKPSTAPVGEVDATGDDHESLADGKQAGNSTAYWEMFQASWPSETGRGRARGTRTPDP